MIPNFYPCIPTSFLFQLRFPHKLRGCNSVFAVCPLITSTKQFVHPHLRHLHPSHCLPFPPKSPNPNTNFFKLSLHVTFYIPHNSLIKIPTTAKVALPFPLTHSPDTNMGSSLPSAPPLQIKIPK